MEVVAYVATQGSDHLIILEAAETDRTLILALKFNSTVSDFWQRIYNFVFEGRSLSIVDVGFTDRI